MRSLKMPCRVLSVVVGLFVVPAAWGQSAVEFNRDVRPILSNNCFLCHGPDKSARKGDLRLDNDVNAYDDRGEGVRVIVPGKPAESELYKRLVTHDQAKKMPPAKANKTVTEKEIAIVKAWIEQGGQ